MTDASIQNPLQPLVDSAIAKRATLRSAYKTDAYRMFHGVSEGRPGLTIDRYASEIVIQIFRSEIEEDWESLASSLMTDGVTGISVVRRGAARGIASSEGSKEAEGVGKEVLATFGELESRVVCQEDGSRFWNSLTRKGNDPWFYLDFRATRRFIKSIAAGKRVANFFAYTGTAGIVAAKAGAAQVTQVDFGEWCLDAARDNAALNEVEIELVRDDFFSVARQWAGGKAKNRGRGRGRGRGGGPGRPGRARSTFPSERFDLVVLDPPTRSTGRNGAVDILRDYPSLAKPCMQMLDPEGWLVCSHHHAGMDFDTWESIVRRTAEKIERPIMKIERILPDPDFPILGEEPLLKVMAVQLG